MKEERISQVSMRGKNKKKPNREKGLPLIKQSTRWIYIEQEIKMEEIFIKDRVDCNEGGKKIWP